MVILKAGTLDESFYGVQQMANCDGAPRSTPSACGYARDEKPKPSVSNFCSSAS